MFTPIISFKNAHIYNIIYCILDSTDVKCLQLMVLLSGTDVMTLFRFY